MIGNASPIGVTKLLKQRANFSSICCAGLIALSVLSMLYAGAAPAASGLSSACDARNALRQDFDMQVPFEVIDGRIYVEAEVNRRGPYKFALDTGASGLGRADASLVAALNLTIQTPALNSDGVTTVEADTVHIGSLSVGGLSRRSFDVITRDYNSKMSKAAAFAGIIARDFFADGLLVIDYPRKTLSFSRKLAVSSQHASVLTYERAFRVPVSIGGVLSMGNLDTGANVAFVFPQSLFYQVRGTPLQQAGTGQLANSQIDTQRSTIYGPITIGGVSLSSVEVRVSETYPELLIGAHALQHFAVLIDQRSRTVALCE